MKLATKVFVIIVLKQFIQIIFENLKNKFMKIECEINRNIIYKFYSKNKNGYLTDIILNVINQEIEKLKTMKEMVLKEFKKQNEINYNIYSFISILYDNYSQNKKIII